MSELLGRPVGILGTGMCIPKKITTNDDLEKTVDSSDEWIVSRTGIRSRYLVSEGESNESLSVSASLMAMKAANVTPDEIDMIVAGTNSPEMIFPGIGAAIQGSIGAKKSGGMDVQAGCPGGLFAMVTVANGIASGMWNNALAVGSEAISRFLDWSDRSTCVLFGDGAGACVLGKWKPGMPRLRYADLKTDGTKRDFAYLQTGAGEKKPEKHFVKMRGNEIYKFVNREIPDYLEVFCADCGIGTHEVDWWIFHQANLRILEGVFKRMNIPWEKAVINLDRLGNTSAASVMIGLHEALLDGRIRSGQRVVLTSFGAGMTYGATLLEA